jgi:hypothetical protein
MWILMHVNNQATISTGLRHLKKNKPDNYDKMNQK